MYEQNENQVTKYAEDLFTIKYTVVIPDIGEMWPITQNTATQFIQRLLRTCL